MRTFKNRKTKYIPAVFLIILFLAVAGILLAVFLYKDDKGGNILAGASPYTSAFQVYYFDGETVAVRTLYDKDGEKELIKKINSIPLQEAEESALSQMESPFYGFWISSQDGFDISVAASGGVWIRNDGAVYYGDTDLSLLWEQMEGKDEDTWNVLNFPSAGRLSAYHTFFLLKADEQTAEGPEGLTMTVEDIGTREGVFHVASPGETASFLMTGYIFVSNDTRIACQSRGQLRAIWMLIRYCWRGRWEQQSRFSRRTELGCSGFSEFPSNIFRHD